MSEDPYRELAGAYVVGSLEDAERREFEAHLADCPQCQRDVVDFSALPPLLSRVDPRSLESDGLTDLSEGVIAAAREDQAGMQRSRLRWRMAAISVVAAAAVVFAIALVTRDGTSDGDRLANPDAEFVVTSSYPLDGTISLTSQPWGTLILVDLFDAPHRDQYSMWTVATDGAWTEIGTWGWSKEGTCRVPGASSLALASIDRVVVTGAGDKTDELAVGG